MLKKTLYVTAFVVITLAGCRKDPDCPTEKTIIEKCPTTEKVKWVLDGNISIYPNPNKGNFTLDLGGKGEGAVQIEIFDLTGRKQFSLATQFYSDGKQLELNLSMLPSGVYLLKASRDSVTKTIKIVIA